MKALIKLEILALRYLVSRSNTSPKQQSSYHRSSTLLYLQSLCSRVSYCWFMDLWSPYPRETRRGVNSGVFVLLYLTPTVEAQCFEVPQKRHHTYGGSGSAALVVALFCLLKMFLAIVLLWCSPDQEKNKCTKFFPEFTG